MESDLLKQAMIERGERGVEDVATAGEGAGGRGLTDEELLGGIDFEKARELLKGRALGEQMAMSSEDDGEGGEDERVKKRADRKDMVEREKASEFRLNDVEESGDEALELDLRLKRL